MATAHTASQLCWLSTVQTGVGSFTGDPGGCVKDGTGEGLHRGPAGEPGTRLSGTSKGERRRDCGVGYLS